MGVLLYSFLYGFFIEDYPGIESNGGITVYDQRIDIKLFYFREVDYQVGDSYQSLVQ